MASGNSDKIEKIKRGVQGTPGQPSPMIKSSVTGTTETNAAVNTTPEETPEPSISQNTKKQIKTNTYGTSREAKNINSKQTSSESDLDFQDSLYVATQYQLKEQTKLIEEKFKKINRSIDKKINTIHEKINKKSDESLEKIKSSIMNEIQKSKEDLQNVKNSVMGSIAIFAAFFTFVSVNINIFTKTNAIESICIMIVMWFCLIGFLYVFFIFLWDLKKIHWIPVTACIVITCLALYYTKNNQTSDTKKDAVQTGTDQHQNTQTNIYIKK